ncbi:MAG: ABC transporter permease [Acidobacteria bacterium]|nr:MAG: ABC transporter permease [Acidobacteriota bacterium]
MDVQHDGGRFNMFFRIVAQSFRRQRRRKAIATSALVLGTSVAVAMTTVALDIGDKINRELKAFGANLVIIPKGRTLPLEVGGEDVSRLGRETFLPEHRIPKIKDIFWRNNILAFAPLLDTPATFRGRTVTLVGTWFSRPVQCSGGTVVTGMRHLAPYWHVDGAWIEDDAQRPQVMVGRSLAEAFHFRLGETMTIEVGGKRISLLITGIVTTGGAEDDQLFTTLDLVQELTHRHGQVARILVSALTTPEDKIYERLGRSPRELSPEEFENWYCTPFVSSIAFQLNEVFPTAQVKPIRRVVESEGRILNKVKLMMMIIAALALIAATLAVMSTMMAMVLERRPEIGLMKAMGSSDGSVVRLFLAEAFIIGLMGAVIGSGIGVALAEMIGQVVFGVHVRLHLLVLPVSFITAELVTLVGCAAPVRMLLRLRPVDILRSA